MIHGLRRGLRLPVELMTDVVEQRGLGDFRQRLGRLFEPVGEVQQILNPAVEPVEIARDARVYWASQLLRTSPNG